MASNIVRAISDADAAIPATRAVVFRALRDAGIERGCADAFVSVAREFAERALPTDCSGEIASAWAEPRDAVGRSAFGVLRGARTVKRVRPSRREIVAIEDAWNCMVDLHYRPHDWTFIHHSFDVRFVVDNAQPQGHHLVRLYYVPRGRDRTENLAAVRHRDLRDWCEWWKMGETVSCSSSELWDTIERLVSEHRNRVDVK